MANGDYYSSRFWYELRNGNERQLLLKNLADKLSRFKDGEPLFWHCKVWRSHVR